MNKILEKNKCADSNLSIGKNFMKYFSMDLAYTPEQKLKTFSIRYRVYCEEFQYESTEKFPGAIEYDEYDSHSLHYLITHKSTLIPAACVRIIPASADKEKSPLPFEKYCAKSIDEVLLKELTLERNSICEISRLAVDGVFRRRSGEKSSRCGQLNLSPSYNEQRTFSYIALASFLASIAIANITDRHNAFAMMEPFLPRLLKRYGIIFHKAGFDIDYHGNRALYYCNTHTTLSFMRNEVVEFYNLIFDAIWNDFITGDSSAIKPNISYKSSSFG